MTIKPLDGCADGGEPYTDEELEIINAECPICDGEAELMGQLGNLRWYRCMDCGMEFSREAD